MRLSEYYQTVPFKKSEPTEKEKAREDRREALVKKHVRAECVDRDGYCRVQSDDPALLAIVGPCSGFSQWSHWEAHRRAHTRGQAPEHRHTTAGSGMLCDGHHTAYDARDWQIEYLTPRGADGPVRVYTETQEYREG
jgi:hypothetical protein